MANKTLPLWKDDLGLAALEFAVTAPVLLLLFTNGFDLASYIWDYMAVENAAQMGAQAARSTCTTASLVPATLYCSSLNTAITAAIQSTALGTQVTLAASSPSEGYYCVNTSNSLQYVSSVSNKPVDCTAAGASTLKPGDYINVQVAYTYTPMFTNLSVGSLLPTPITASSWMRLQ